MATYKVPQDVEADDKLLGPFSFKQFIYLIIAILGVVMAWGLSTLFIPLAILPLPVIVLFGALSLPLKKDQPMEIYLAAVLSFYLKPRKRLWRADGVQSLVEIVAPKVVEEHRTKDLSQTEAERRLSYLANLVDSRGWAVRGVNYSPLESVMQENIFLEAQQAEDMLDDSSPVTHTFDSMIDQADLKRRQEAMDIVTHPASQLQVPAIPDPYANLHQAPVQSSTNIEGVQESTAPIAYNPYPASMHQTVILPSSEAPAQPTENATEQVVSATSNEPISPDIINLANNTDLSVATIEREAERILKKEQGEEEVIITLR